MRLVAVAGTRGSGKTTLVRALVSRLAAAAKRSAVIVNEDGPEVYDPDFVKAHGLAVVNLRGG